MIVETFGDWIQRFATLFEGGGQAILVCSGNQSSPKGSCYSRFVGRKKVLPQVAGEVLMFFLQAGNAG